MRKGWLRAGFLRSVRGVPRRVTVRGGSMAPTLRDGDVVLAVGWLRPADGAVALVRWPQRPGQLSVKRLALRFPDDDPAGACWFAVGDASTASTDSRSLGPAVALAVVTHRLWPAPGRLPRR
ncbi:S26 family signal peptidase [Actinomycetospora endophytica]|uniref:S26 family signal peptidase n=1 Tax=Actinomycetospora endophytica TaxID=2291215 RepID=A0ABS8PHH0_9PSEU|nr:S26 family signal peptidase [Actinomycetospora endophytica]MCD2197488.1 S26 family signal peptidase [Actinomycetospora endophytica]